MKGLPVWEESEGVTLGEMVKKGFWSPGGKKENTQGTRRISFNDKALSLKARNSGRMGMMMVHIVETLVNSSGVWGFLEEIHGKEGGMSSFSFWNALLAPSVEMDTEMFIGRGSFRNQWRGWIGKFSWLNVTKEKKKQG